eukprot:SAG31_NODE_258_length_18937_cov_61.688555_11_plen_99_part_00
MLPFGAAGQDDGPGTHSCAAVAAGAKMASQKSAERRWFFFIAAHSALDRGRRTHVGGAGWVGSIRDVRRVEYHQMTAVYSYQRKWIERIEPPHVFPPG